MDGVKKSNKDIDQFIKSHNIVLENFCNFLLQEKVAAFAKLSGDPTKILREIEEAVGPVGMIDDHDQLVSIASAKKDSERALQMQKEQLIHLEQREADIKNEMARHEQLNLLEERIRLLELKIPMLKVSWTINHSRQAAASGHPATAGQVSGRSKPICREMNQFFNAGRIHSYLPGAHSARDYPRLRALAIFLPTLRGADRTHGARPRPGQAHRPPMYERRGRDWLSG